MDLETWTAFVARARTDGKLIEGVIKDVYRSNLPTNAVAIDGGANVGFHTIGLAEHLVEGRVLAVEANAVTFESLQKNTRRFSHVQPVLAALQDDEAATQSPSTVRLTGAEPHPFSGARLVRRAACVPKQDHVRP